MLTRKIDQRWDCGWKDGLANLEVVLASGQGEVLKVQIKLHHYAPCAKMIETRTLIIKFKAQVIELLS